MKSNKQSSVITPPNSISVPSPAGITFPENEKNTSLVEDLEKKSILELKDHENIIAEPAGAMSSASLWHFKEKIIGKNVGCIICGGNNDESRMPEIIRRAKKWKTNNPNH